MEPVTLYADALVLDQPTEADIPFVTEYCQDPLFEKFMTLPWPYSKKDAEFFVHEYVPGGWSRGDEVTWAIRADGTFLGVVGVREENSMIGYWMGAEHRGNGYMTSAVAAAVNWVFTNGWSDSVRWEAVEGNFASLQVARKTGFRYSGLGPALVTARDGSAPPSWRAELRKADDRTVKGGWPNTSTTGAP